VGVAFRRKAKFIAGYNGHIYCFLSVRLGFAICWSVWKKDMQDAFGVAAYITGVMGPAVTTWQMWAL